MLILIYQVHVRLKTRLAVSLCLVNSAVSSVDPVSIFEVWDRQKEANGESEAAGEAARLRKSGIQHESMVLNAGRLCEHTHETLWTLTCTNHLQIKHWMHSALWITARPAEEQTLSCNNITNIHMHFSLFQFSQRFLHLLKKVQKSRCCGLLAMWLPRCC